MTDLSSSEQLKIANSGGLFNETGSYSWNGKKIRKGNKIGKVIQDQNGAYRILTIKFDDETEDVIEMNNTGPDPKYVHDYEWFSESGQKWYRF